MSNIKNLPFLLGYESPPFWISQYKTNALSVSLTYDCCSYKETPTGHGFSNALILSYSTEKWYKDLEAVPQIAATSAVVEHMGILPQLVASDLLCSGQYPSAIRRKRKSQSPKVTFKTICKWLILQPNHNDTQADCKVRKKDSVFSRKGVVTTGELVTPFRGSVTKHRDLEIIRWHLLSSS